MDFGLFRWVFGKKAKVRSEWIKIQVGGSVPTKAAFLLAEELERKLLRSKQGEEVGDLRLIAQQSSNKDFDVSFDGDSVITINQVNNPSSTSILHGVVRR